MIKVFEDFDITLVGHYQSVLESNDIATFMKNQFGTSGAGELPFVEVVPQLWVLNEADIERAKALIEELHDPDNTQQLKAWDCPRCGTAQEAAFTHCWKCSAARP
jgi:rubrerythrin